MKVEKKRWSKQWRMLMIGFVLIATSIGGLIYDAAINRKPAIPLGDYSYAIDYVENEVDDLIKKHELPSVVIALIDGDEVVYAKPSGFSNLEENTPATLDTRYQAGSITKVFTAIEIMRLVEDGAIDLDAPVTEYLPDFSIQNRFESAPITVRSLLAHRSGLPRNDTLLGWYWDARPDVLKAQVDSLAEAYQAYPVGVRYKYSNIAYEVLGRIVEVKRGIRSPGTDAVSGWPYYMKDKLLLPLGMEDTNFGSDLLLYGREVKKPPAMGYRVEEGKAMQVNQFDIIQLASGNMWITMNDLIRFAQTVIHPERFEDAGIFSEETLQLMFEPQVVRDRDPQPNGLAWFTDSEMLGEPLVFHTGTGQGFTAVMMLMPEQELGVLALSNSFAFEEVQITLVVRTLALMLEAKAGIVQEDKPVREAAVDSKILDRYIGKYVINGEIIEVVQKGNRLNAIYQERPFKMIPVAQNKFHLSHWLADMENITMEFWVDDPEEEDLMIVTMGDHFLCPRYPEVKEVPELWKILIGRYEMFPRVPSMYSEEESLGTVEITIDDRVLMMSDGKVLLPLDESWIRIMGGIYAGEIMERDMNTGELVWQDRVFRQIGSIQQE